MKNQDIYGEPVVLHLEGCTARVYHPIISDEERARRMKIIEEAAARLLKTQERIRMQQERGEI